MDYLGGISHPSLVELARSGNFKAIARWLNLAFAPYGMRTYVGSVRPGLLNVLVELPTTAKQRKLPAHWQDYLVRFVCQRLWKLNSARIEGVRVAARFAGQSTLLFRRSVRIVSPARRQRQQRSLLLKTQVRHTMRRKKQMRAIRTVAFSGPAVAAFLIGSIFGYSKAPSEQTNAVASSSQAATSSPVSRPSTVTTAIGKVPVIKQTQVAKPNDPTVSLMFSGDVTLADSFAETIGTDYKRAFAQMDELRQADVAMVNLENPLTRATIPMPNKQFNFKADPALVKVLQEGGVDLVTLANNHTMDYHAEGLEETMATLDQAGIQHIGAGRNTQEARRPDIVEVKGQRIAYLAYYGEEYAATATSAGTNPIVEERIAQDIKAIRNQVDWVVVNYHWGQELAEVPAEWQVHLAHFTVDQGADLVVGHHPHVLQGAEVYNGSPIAYSLGNFIFGGNARSDYDTAVMRVALKDKQMKVEFLPVEVRGYQAKVVGGKRGSEILQQIETRSAGFEQPMPTSVTLDARTRSQPSPAPSSWPAQPAPTGASSSPMTPAEAPGAPTNDASIAPVNQPTMPDPIVEPGGQELNLPTESTTQPLDRNQPTGQPASQPTDAMDGAGSAGRPVQLPNLTPSSAETPSPSDSLHPPTDPFINSPDRTPLSPSNRPDPAVSQPAPNPFSEPNPHQPDAAVPRNPAVDEQESVPSLAVPEDSVTVQPQSQPQGMKTTQGAKAKVANQSGSPVGEDLIPDVATLAISSW